MVPPPIPKQSERKPPSALRIQHPVQTLSQQFAPTPRFSVSSAARRNEDVEPRQSSSPLVSRVRRPGSRVKREDIEESTEGEDAGAGTSRDDKGQDRERLLLDSEEEYVQQRTLKRRRRASFSPSPSPPQTRRLTTGPKPDAIYISEDDNDNSNNEDHLNSNPPSPSSPIHPPASHPHPTTIPTIIPRFLPTHTHSTATFTSAPQPHTRPPFILPTPVPAQSSTPHPLPELFSPHRRGQKYLPDGLASTARDWIFEKSSQTSSTTTTAQRLHVEEVTHYRGAGVGAEGGMIFLQAEGIDTDAGRELGLEEPTNGTELSEKNNSKNQRKKMKKKWLLIGPGTKTTRKAARAGEEEKEKEKQIRQGLIVGVKRPVWEIGVEGERWGVGVDFEF